MLFLPLFYLLPTIERLEKEQEGHITQKGYSHGAFWGI
jgi:hypothetical protein